MRPFGAGTQKLVDEAAGRFPGPRIARMDADTTRRKGDHERILRMFYRREADILVGTQMIAKGLDLPGVTLVGVVSADTALHFPDFPRRRTDVSIAGASGRAGGPRRPPRPLVLQTYTPGHYAIQAAARHDFDAFAAKELQFRSAAGYPPYVHLTRVLFRGLDEHKVRQTAESAARWLQAAWGRGAEGLGHNRIIGPTPAPITRLKGRYRWHILLKGERADLAAAASRLATEWTCPDDVAMSVDPGPVSLL